jgi:hypothetical protein
MRPYLTLLFLVLLAACQRAERPGADAALVILRFDNIPTGMIARTFPGVNTPIPIGAPDYSIVLSRYDTADGQIAGSNFGEVTLSTTKADNGLIGKPIQPGTYVFTRFVVADRWGECFGRTTWRFDAAPGQVIYFGALDPQIHTSDLMRAATVANRRALQGTSALGDRYVWYGNTTAPVFRPLDPALGAFTVEAYAQAHFPAFTAQPQQADLHPASFGMDGKLVNVGIPSCGSMFY